MYYTDREVREILEQVYAEAYDQGIDDTLDYIDENYEIEDDSFDLEDEYDVYTEMLSSGLKQHIRIYGKNLEKQGITGQDKTDLIKGKIANVYQHRLKDDSAPFEHKSGRTYDIGYKVGEKVDNKLAANKKLSDADKKASEDANRKTYRRGVYDPEKMY